MHKVHEYYGSIFGKKAHFKVTSVAGHVFTTYYIFYKKNSLFLVKKKVFTTDFPNEYKDWKKIDP